MPLARLCSVDPTGFEAARGTEAGLWTGLVHIHEAAGNRLWPRLVAAAELAWCPAGVRGYDGCGQRMGALRADLDALGIGCHAGARPGRGEGN